MNTIQPTLCIWQIAFFLPLKWKPQVSWLQRTLKRGSTHGQKNENALL
ncbi:hypothetical protein PDIG_10290 [Penicillium digitatum PHI26]|uniref:Uncharacterized protein n=1 Tax=Penicillium digitatum (strain PHI26 / CECT 20796) TaxID=1170229 RepID=K9GBA7_PEND2|nr:hypothetical protein PDIG_10290 [Penicillium digitatum PHI26]